MPQVAMRAGRAARRLGPVLLGLALALGCGKKDGLEGSLGEILDLDYASVEVALAADSVSIAFVRPRGEGLDVVLKLVASLTPDVLEHGGVVNLAPMEDGTVRATLTRAVADDPARELAPIVRGELRLGGAPAVDRGLSGELRATLGEGGVGEGRTVFGNFSTGRVLAAQ